MLVWAEQALPVGEGEIVIGRGSDCDVVLDESLISRRHARLVVTSESVRIEDLLSSNGVYVNGIRIDRSHRLCEGDRILIGTRELSAFEYRSAPGADPASESRLSREPTRPQVGVTTTRADPFLVIGRMADRLLAAGRVDEAERVLDDHLTKVLDGARSALVVPSEVCEAASGYAIRLAKVARQGKWIDYAVELHLRARRVMSREVVDAICDALPFVPWVDADLFRHYLETLRTTSTGMSRYELEIVNRLACLNLPRR
jgi:hypothetical protein